jgi:hypothetical protein
MAVYCIALPSFDAIKVGFADNVEHRLAQLQTGCPYDLQVIAVADGGDFAFERACHRLLHSWGAHLRGEWFSGAAVCRFLAVGGLSDQKKFRFLVKRKVIEAQALQFDLTISAEAQQMVSSEQGLLSNVIPFVREPKVKSWESMLRGFVRKLPRNDCPGTRIWNRDLQVICGLSVSQVDDLVLFGELPGYSELKTMKIRGWQRVILREWLEERAAVRTAELIVEKVSR